jgi:tetratricopeptide (TPR) repeat protein
MTDSPAEHRHARLLDALRAQHAALQKFLEQQDISNARDAAQQLHEISEQCGDLFPALWAELQVGNVPTWLQGMRMPDALREQFEKFSAAREDAEKIETGDAWRAAAQMGEALLAHNDAARLPYTPEQWHAELANMWNHTGIVLSNERQHAGALTAFDNAIQHQAGNTTLHRNRANTNIDLGDFDAAEQDLVRAEELEPGHAIVAELRAEMEGKRGQ